MKKLLLFCAFIIGFQFTGLSTHISGGHTQITKLGTDTFEIKVNVIRDCSGIFAPQSIPVTITDSCGFSASYTAGKVSSFFFTPYCTSGFNSTCNGGSVPGYEIVEYRDTITFSSSCNSVFAFADLGCCRPYTGNLQNASNSNIVVMAMLNRNNPIGVTPPFAYLHQLVNGVSNHVPTQILVDSMPTQYDAEYEFYQPLGAIGSSIPFTASNSITSPFLGATINASSGLISINPNALGEYSIPVKTTIMASNPNWSSYAKFEMRARVTSAQDSIAPTISVSNAPNFNQTGDTLTPCSPGSCFDLVVSDNLTQATLTIISTNLPIAGVTGTNPKTITVCPSSISGTEKFFIMVEDSCNGLKSTKLLYLNQVTNPSLTGTVTSGSGAVTNTMVLMVGFDTTAGQVYAVDTTFTDNSGAYSFPSVSDSLVLIKAIPDSTAYPMLIPTYHDSALTALSAQPLPQYCYHSVANIWVQAGVNPGGNGFIAGNVYQGAGKNNTGEPVSGLTLLLKNSSGKLIASKNTAASGAFTFSNLTDDSYQIFVDNGSVTNQNPPVIDLNETNEITLNLTLYKSELVIESVVSAKQNRSALVTSLLPNPFSDHLQVTLSESGNFQFKLTDVFGKMVWHEQLQLSKGSHTLAPQNLAEGIYFLQVQYGDQTLVKKIVKQ